MRKPANYWIERLELEPHPEGGFFKETYRSSVSAEFTDFPSGRNVSTGIYFFLTSENFSAFHRIKSDEMWHFYAGDALSISVIDKNGKANEIILGLDLEKGQVPQAVVPANCWFASKVKDGGEYGLVGCTVSPGFDFEDFKMADRQHLIAEYPRHKELITSLTRV
ncbi:MAG: cupin domain-containing protein [Reichenbachiella sp.]|uniref:cupin domain-containing protein n=1 Tax=Reichenbachiella sp. TaxID=2184521 RepID=UPI00329A4242